MLEDEVVRIAEVIGRTDLKLPLVRVEDLALARKEDALRLREGNRERLSIHHRRRRLVKCHLLDGPQLHSMPTATLSRCCLRMAVVRSPRRCLGGRRPWMGGDARWRGRCAVARPSAAARRASSGSDCGARRLSDETRRSLRIWALTDLELAPRAYPWLKRFARRIAFNTQMSHTRTTFLSQAVSSCPLSSLSSHSQSPAALMRTFT